MGWDETGGGGRLFLPFRQLAPDAKPVESFADVLERLQHRRCPQPAGTAHACRDACCVLVQFQRAAGEQTVQQGGRDIRQQRRRVFERDGRIDIERQRQAARCRRDRTPGQDEGKEFEQIQRRSARPLAEAAEGGRRMDQHRRPQAAQDSARLLGRQHQQLAIFGEDGSAAETADKGGNGCQVSAFRCREPMPVIPSPSPGTRYLTTDP